MSAKTFFAMMAAFTMSMQGLHADGGSYGGAGGSTYTGADGSYNVTCKIEGSNIVDQLRLEYSWASDSDTAEIYAKPYQGSRVKVATITATTTATTFEFPDTTEFCSFDVDHVNGRWIYKGHSIVEAILTLDSPADVAISNNITGTSFDAYWNSVDGGKGYKVYVWTNAVVGASVGTAVWQESFTNSPAKSNSTAFNVSYTDSGESAWTFDKVYAHSEAGMVRIGNTSAKGVLVSPPLGEAVAIGEPLVLRIRVCKQASSDGDFMPIGIVSGDITNVLEVIELTTTPTEYQIALPALSATDRLAFHSPTNKSSARAILDEAVIVSGYSEGHEEPSYIVDGLDVGEALSHTFTDLPSVPVQFAVEAYGRRGISSTKTDAVQIDLANPDKVAMLNACPLSSLMGLDHNYTYSQNFNSLAYVKSTSVAEDWMNGTTLPYWQAFQDENAIDSMSLYKGGNATGVKFLVLATNENDTVRALGARLKQSTTMEWGMVFTNDTDSTICLSSVSYNAEQWGFANTTNQTLALSYLVTNRLEWIAVYTGGWSGCVSTETPFLKDNQHATFESVKVDYAPESVISIRPGEVLALKWSFNPPASGNSALMAINNVTVTFATAEGSKGLVLKVVKTDRKSSLP